MPTEPATAAEPAAEEEPEEVPEVPDTPDTAAAEAPAVPEGWEATLSKSQGEYYFVNQVRPAPSPAFAALS